MFDEPENEGRGPFIKDLIDQRDYLFRIENNDGIPVSHVINILQYLCCRFMGNSYYTFALFTYWYICTLSTK